MRLGRCVVATGLVAGFAVQSCAGGEEGDPASGSYMLLDREAREAGFFLDGVEGLESAVLPVAVEPGREINLVGPDAVRTLTLEPGQIAVVRGAEGAVDLREIGAAADPDRLEIEADDASARDLADLVGAELLPGTEGRWEIHAPGVLAGAAVVPAPEGVIEVLPVTPAPERSAATVTAAPPRTTATTGAMVPAPADPTLERLAILSAHDADYADFPAAAVCGDPVQGVWVARKYYASYGDWYTFTLRIRRGVTSPNVLTGEVLAHSWSGGPAQIEPLACGTWIEDWTVRMPARGRIAGGTIHFGGTSWEMESSACGSGPGGYNLDQFSGSIATDGQDPVWLNNDGGRSVDDDLSFRRVSCDLR